MKDESISSNLLDLLNEALRRELHVSVQYMLQHAVGAGKGYDVLGKGPSAKRLMFVGSHAQVWLPGTTLKKIAIAEMRHAEAIAERIVVLGRKPATDLRGVMIGNTIKQMLEIDRNEEEEAIELYTHIIEVAREEHDDITTMMFQRILLDEERHHGVFENLLKPI